MTRPGRFLQARTANLVAKSCGMRVFACMAVVCGCGCVSCVCVCVRVSVCVVFVVSVECAFFFFGFPRRHGYYCSFQVVSLRPELMQSQPLTYDSSVS